MSTPFQRTQRVYMADGFQRSYGILFCALLLLGVWFCFFFFSSIAVDENLLADPTSPVASTEKPQPVIVKTSPASLLLQSLGR